MLNGPTVFGRSLSQMRVPTGHSGWCRHIRYLDQAHLLRVSAGHPDPLLPIATPKSLPAAAIQPARSSSAVKTDRHGRIAVPRQRVGALFAVGCRSLFSDAYSNDPVPPG